MSHEATTLMQEPAVREFSASSLDEILTPVREQFAATGMSEDELDALIDEERRTIRAEKQRMNAAAVDHA